MTALRTLEASSLDAAADALLLEAWAKGCRVSGARLIERYAPILQRFFRSKVKGAHVEDLVQETLLAGLESQPRFRGDAPFKNFILAIARNQLFMYIRRSQKSGALDHDLSSARDLGTTPTGALARRSRDQALLEALQTLPLDYQIVLELVFWEGLGGLDVAEILGVSCNGVYSRLFRAKSALREALNQRRRGLARRNTDSQHPFERWARDLRQRCGR